MCAVEHHRYAVTMEYHNSVLILECHGCFVSLKYHDTIIMSALYLTLMACMMQQLEEEGHVA
jgi:hypothetical protein